MGASIRRLAKGQRLKPFERKLARALASVGLILAVPGSLFVLIAIVALLVSDWGSSQRGAGLAVWFLYAATLPAERRGSWRFRES
jgi:hypothetical protein